MAAHLEDGTAAPDGTAALCGADGTSVRDGAGTGGWSLVGRLWHRSPLGIYPRWLGLELPLRAAWNGLVAKRVLLFAICISIIPACDGLYRVVPRSWFAIWFANSSVHRVKAD
jgi:hypothetical protein